MEPLFNRKPQFLSFLAELIRVAPVNICILVLSGLRFEECGVQGLGRIYLG